MKTSKISYYLLIFCLESSDCYKYFFEFYPLESYFSINFLNLIFFIVIYFSLILYLIEFFYLSYLVSFFLLLFILFEIIYKIDFF